MVLGAAGSTPAPEDRERLYQAVVKIEDVIMRDKGKLLLELVHRDDLKRIQKLLKKGIKRRGKRFDRLAQQLAAEGLC